MPAFYQVTKMELVLGLPAPFKIVHISDNHISTTDSLSDEQECAAVAHSTQNWMNLRQSFAEEFGEPFGEEHKIPSTEAFEKLVAYAEEEKADLLLMTGDVLDFVHEAGIRYMEEKLSQLKIPYMYITGNHEKSVARLGNMMHLMGGSPSLQIMKCNGFKIIGLDNSGRTLDDLQLAELETELDGTPAVIAAHIPIGTDMSRDAFSKLDPYFLIDRTNCDENAGKMIDLICDEKRNVKAFLCGHVHGYIPSQFMPGKPLIAASSGLVGFIHHITVI